ncbi:MAG: YicC family protein [Nitrospinae bacterium]|nr:YicC family protein [Nitrospinota bacterium]
MQSMTGFARAESENGGKKCVVETRSVNHRFMEINLRMPAKDLELERRIKKLLEQKISRGYVEVTITLGDNGNAKKKLSLDEGLVKQFLAASETLGKKFGVGGSPDMSSILSLKDIFKYEEDAATIEDRWAVLKPVLESAFAGLVVMRESEGAELKKDVHARLEAIEKSAKAIFAARKGQETEIVEKYRKKIAEIAGVEVEKERALIEAAVLAERSDISEELVRLDCHLKQMRELMSSGAPAGRKMEFITQEMNREANTIGSKSVLYEISREVVEIKSNLEKIREQTANVE